MIRVIAFSLCAVAFRLYYLMRKRLRKILQGGGIEKAKSSIKKRGTLVKDICTGEYCVR